MELDNLEARLVDKYGRSNITNKDVLSAALYPKVFEEYQDFVLRYSDLIEKLPTRAFLEPLKEDEEVEIELSKVRGRQGAGDATSGMCFALCCGLCARS
jgi:pyruvate carboxylase